MTVNHKLTIILGVVVLSITATIAAAAVVAYFVFRPTPPQPPLTVRLDKTGPYVIVASKRAEKNYAGAIAKARALHPKSEQVTFDPGDLDPIQKELKKRRPRYALVFIEPDELDVNFAWRWLTMTSELDDDPFVDTRSGFITGDSPESAEAFVDRITEAAAGKVKLPGKLIDNLGPPEQGGSNYFNTFHLSHLAPVLGKRVNLVAISHGKGCFTDDKLDSMDGAGLIHFGGHGHPDQIDYGLNAVQAAKLKLAPCVVFNGACYTGVTHRWFDPIGKSVKEKVVDAKNCFCLKLLNNDVIAYLAAVHPDHGMPVYQEMEHLAWEGASLGQVMKHTYDGVVLGAGGKLPGFEELKDKMPQPRWTPADIMLKGTAARVLFGDPALIVTEKFTSKPFSIDVKMKKDILHIMATLDNDRLKATFTDTYHNDLSPKAPFNDRAFLQIDLPDGWDAVGKVQVVSVKAQGKALKSRLVGYAVEYDQGKRLLHVQVDVTATGFQRSAFRVQGATVELKVHRP